VSGETIRVATEADLDPVTETLWLAFGEDPLWSWAFPDRRGLRPFWRFLIAAALPHRWVWILGDYAAASVWIPPGCEELSREQEKQLEGLLEGLVGPRSDDLLELLRRFDAAHPRDASHYYLSILGTHPDRRGEGLGMRLLDDNLASIDAQGLAAYLEASNPANEPRYETRGFERVGEFSSPDGAHAVGTMWRAPTSG
jgi:GNAT superfamily N-acetyltransferase